MRPRDERTADQIKKDQKTELINLGQMVGSIFKFLLEEDADLEASDREEHEVKDEKRNSRSNLKQNEFLKRVPPVLICIEDMQNIDETSFYILKKLLVKFHRIMVIGLARNDYIERPLFPPAGKT